MSLVVGGSFVNAFWGLRSFNPSLARGLPVAYEYLRRLVRLQKPVSALPLTWDLCVAIASWFTASDRDPCLALGLLLAFDCYLRVGELVSLRCSDVQIPWEFPSGTDLVGLNLRSTKSGRQQSVFVLRHNVAVALVVWVRRLRRKDPNALVFPFSAAQLRTALHPP